MDIITSHNALDFDGLASMVAAGKLYPSAVRVFSGTVSKNVKQFLALYKDSLQIKSPKSLDLSEVKKLIVVDTANAKRLGVLSHLPDRKDIELHVYDHHPPVEGDLRGTVNEIHKLGAGTTILVEIIISYGIYVTPFEATILALGIYEDTGSLLFNSTTVRDAAAVTYLLGMGANLEVIRKFTEHPFTEDQRQLLRNLLSNTGHYVIKNLEIVIAVTQNQSFIKGLDEVVFRLFEVENCDALFAVVEMDKKINLMGRSRTNKLNMNKILKEFGGRGHDKAASVVIKNRNSDEIAQAVLDILEKTIDPGMLARDIMSSPVKTVPIHTSIKDAGRIMLRYGHTGLPVVDNDIMVGLISRRDVEKASIHKLEHAPVKGFMSTSIVSAGLDTTVEDIEKIMVEHDIGRLPILENGKILGIVSRTDMLQILHGQEVPKDHSFLYALNDNKTMNLADALTERLPADFINMLKKAGDLGDELGFGVYCVGGFVRDLILKVPNFDLDLVVEGDGEEFTKKLADILHGRYRLHQRFHTGVIILDNNLKIDVATSRTEYYEFPAALPQVKKSALKEDLLRRDFTINTLAIALNKDVYGEVVDYFGGLKDLEKGCIRILYNLSFVEDPTRILRAVRFEQRYCFEIEQDTLRFAKDAIARQLLDKLSYKRILQELILVLSENDPLPSLERIGQIGAWDYVFPDIKWESLDRTKLKRIPMVIGYCEERLSLGKINRWLVFILELASKLNDEQMVTFIERYNFERYIKKSLKELGLVPKVSELLNNPSIKSSDLHKIINDWAAETVILLLLDINSESAWNMLTDYLDKKGKTKVELNGNDLIRMGIKKGPVYGFILSDLFNKKLDGLISGRDDEIAVVQKITEEEYFDRVVS
ncbi:MAG: CBS domain-containing protein [Syntrophomonadaceae bacterium]|jgi:tRNA nucleotidyltransferase (CCA-adding enzyme)|nr:CBS domain-containing protein [Syntrophomonadaceae bacterium]